MMTVLLVDDDNDDIEIFKEVVEIVDPSIVFQYAHSAKEALAMLESNASAPDYMFLDINMPIMTGLECLAEIRRRFPSLPTIMTIYSTSKTYNSYNEALKLGAGYMIKPDEYQTLVDLLSRKFSETN
jgi:CheY-like chemotaxis protein